MWPTSVTSLNICLYGKRSPTSFKFNFFSKEKNIRKSRATTTTTNQMIESTCFVYKNNFLGQRRRLWFYLFPHVHILILERVLLSVAGKPLVIPFMFVDTLFVLDMYICVYVYTLHRDVCYLGSAQQKKTNCVCTQDL